jgi:hypothetical protein
MGVLLAKRDGSTDQPDEPTDHSRNKGPPATDVYPEDSSREQADGPDPERQGQQIAQAKVKPYRQRSNYH